MTDISSLLLLARHVNIVHHIPGRIRLRLQPSILKVAGDLDIEKLADSLPGILRTRVNMIVGSVTIEYNSSQLSPDLWESMIGCNGDPGEVSKIED